MSDKNVIFQILDDIREGFEYNCLSYRENFPDYCIALMKRLHTDKNEEITLTKGDMLDIITFTLEAQERAHEQSYCISRGRCNVNKVDDVYKESLELVPSRRVISRHSLAETESDFSFFKTLRDDLH